MLQRIQTLYLLLFIVISASLLGGIHILEFAAEGSYIKEKISLHVNTTQIELEGNLAIPASELETIGNKIKASTPIAFDSKTQTLSYSRFSPLLIFQGILVLLGLVVMFSFKNLKRQLNLARLLFFLTLLYVALHMFLAYFALNYARPFIEELPLDDLQVSRITQLGFYLVCALLPFSYLAQLGIKRDYSLIKSLDRLR